MKLGWGYKITILYVGFVAMMVVMVSLTMRQKVDLVSKDGVKQQYLDYFSQQHLPINIACITYYFNVN